MKIYGVYIGDNYEGGTCVSPLFKLKKDALMEAAALANKYNNEQPCNYTLDKNEVWRDGYEFIKVLEYELL